jgi:hypothetical protein
VWLEDLRFIDQSHKKYLLPKNVQNIISIQLEIMKELPMCVLKQFMLENGLSSAQVQFPCLS